MKKRPIFQKIAIPVVFLMIFEMLILLGGLFSQGLIQKLRDNESQVINEKVLSRKENVESQMLNSWMNLTSTVDRVNKETQRYLDTRRISIEELVDSSNYSSDLLEMMAPRLLTMMQMAHVTGAYVILNTDDLKVSMDNGNYQSKQGLYFRTNDPNSKNPDVRNQSVWKNILMIRSPISVLQKLDIAMDPEWDVNFDFSKENKPYYDFFYKPFQMAYEHGDQYRWTDLGCWSGPYDLDDSGTEAIAYSIPLVLDDGTVYGVIGIDVTSSYIQSQLNNYELVSTGTYFLTQYRKGTDEIHKIFGEDNGQWIESQENDTIEINAKDYYYHIEDLHLYANNTPFAEEQWALGAAIPYASLYTYVSQLKVILTFAVLMALAIGMIGSVYMSYHIQQPISHLAQLLKTQDPRAEIALPMTGISEIDQMTEELENLSHDVIESGRRFSRILEMASTSIGGFQINESENTIFLTENFFEIFGRSDLDIHRMSLEQFRNVMKAMEHSRIEPRDLDMEGSLFQVSVKGKPRFVQLRISEDGQNIYGLVEDVTKALLEKQVMTYERDHDSLTGLFNRRAFRRIMHRLFDETPEDIQIGAFLMFDLDNLKYVNDTFGHDYGDHYIRQAADAIEHGISGKNYCARISGDEFHVFLFGHKNREEVQAEIGRLKECLSRMSLMLPDGRVQKLHASGGVAWYPDDSTSMEQLTKYADHAMYVAKKTHKGEIAYFDKNKYQSQSMQVRDAAALTQLIANCEIYYAVQPIVDAHTGEIYGYEALMRSLNRDLPNVGRILDVAREEGKLNQIEEMTWLNAIGRYAELVRSRKISPESKIFINTIPNQELDLEVQESYRREYGEFLSNTIMELTEEEKIDNNMWERKKMYQREVGGMIALDDYGTGYNGEKTLLTIEPDFIKLDISLIRDIDRNADKQALMRYMADYAHNKGILLIAEGVETRGEMETVIRLGADLLQGFYLAKPEKEPARIPEQVKDEIRRAAKAI